MGLLQSILAYVQAGLSTDPERMQRVHTRTCIPFPPEVAILTRCRFGSQRLLFLLLAWLTLLPVVGPFPQIAHFFDMTKLLEQTAPAGILKSLYRDSLISSGIVPFQRGKCIHLLPALDKYFVLFFCPPREKRGSAKKEGTNRREQCLLTTGHGPLVLSPSMDAAHNQAQRAH